MSTDRLEAFSDGVFAILITIMVLDLKLPHGPGWATLTSVQGAFSAYMLSFVFLGIYWTNHHHVLAATREIDGRVLWANLHLLFWLSLTPVTTGWLGENHFEPVPLATYGGVLLGAAGAYYLLERAIISVEGKESPLALAVGKDRKVMVSGLLYSLGILAAFVLPWLAWAMYLAVATMWVIPDPRIEAHLKSARDAETP
jgi:TMEM175 potassium channel family protein